MIAPVCNPSPRSPRADKWTVSQTKSDMHFEYIFTQKTSQGCETHTRHTVIPRGNTKEHTGASERWQRGGPGVSRVAQKLFVFFRLKHVVVTGCYLRTQDMKEGACFGTNEAVVEPFFSSSCSEKHQRMSKMRNSLMR